MDKQQEATRIHKGLKILFWFSLLIFFVYSFQNTMDLEGIANPRRQESFLRVLTALFQPNFLDGETGRQVATKMWETIQIAFLATTMSAVFAIPFTFLSARPSSLWGRGFNLLLQPVLSAIRAVHPLIVTVPAIVLAGIGPTAGVLSLIFFSTAVLVDDFSEYAQQQTFLNWPELLKVHFPGLAFKRLSINTLIATVIGFMGGGGIGILFRQQISLLNYREASVAILACIVTIGSLDLFSRAVWYKIQKHETSLPSTPEVANLH